MIDPSGQYSKFIPDDFYGKEVIGLNKQMIQPLVNAKIDKFYKETIILNLQILWHVKNSMMRATGATWHGNRYFVVKLDKDVAFVVNLLLAQAFFQEVLGQESDKNGETKNADLFQQGTAVFTSCKPLRNYL